MKTNRFLSMLLLVASTCCFTQVIVESHVLSRGCVASDVVFLVDSSSAVSASDFRRQLTFLRDVVDRLPIGPDSVRASLVTYGLRPPRVRFALHRHPSKARLRDAIDGGPQPQRKTLAEAISLARRDVLLGGMPRSSSAGPATGPATGPAVVIGRVMVIVVGGGLAGGAEAKVEALRAREDGVVVIGVEVGRGVGGEEEEEEEMVDLVSSPVEQHTLGVADFADLAKIRDLTARKICEVKASTANPVDIASVPADILRSRESDISDRTHKLPGSDSESYLPPTTHGYLFHGRISRHAYASVTHPPASTTKPSKQDAIPRSTEPVSSRTDGVLAAQAIQTRPSGPTALPSTGTSLLFNKGTVSGVGLDMVARLAPDSIAPTDVNAAERYINAEKSERTVTVGVSILKSTTVESQSTELSATRSTVNNANPRDTGTSPSSAHTLGSEPGSSTQSTVDHSSIDGHSLLVTHLEKPAVSKSNRPLGTMDADHVFSTVQTTEVNSVKVLRRIQDTRGDVSIRHSSVSGTEIPTDDHNSHADLKSHGAQRQRETVKRHMTEYDTRDRVASTDEMPRIRYQASPGYRSYWRPDERGRLVHYREVRPGVFEKDGSPESFQGPPSENGDPRSPVGPSLQQRGGKRLRRPSTRGNFNASTYLGRGFGTKKVYNVPPMVGPDRGVRPGSAQETQTARNSSRSCDDPRQKVTGFYRFNDLGLLVWQNFTAAQMLSQGRSNTSSNCRGEPLTQDPVTGMITPRPFPPMVTTTQSSARKHRDRTRTIPGAAEQGHWMYDPSGRRVWITHSPHRRQETPPLPAEIHRPRTPATPGENSSSSVDPFLERPSYGFWNHENGERIWYEYDPSSRAYRPVNDSAGGEGQGSKKVRLELPPSLASIARSRINVTSCRGCDVIVPPHPGDKSSAGDGDFVEGAKLRLLSSSSGIESPPPVGVSGLRRPWTYGLSRQNSPDHFLGRGNRPKRRRIQPSPVIDQHPGHEKPFKVCTARHPLSAAFMIDPRSLDRSQAKRLWQLAFDVVRRMRMDDGRVRIQFFPELQRTPANSSSTTGTSASAHGDHTMMAADRKPVPDLLRSVAHVLLNNSAIGGGGGGGGGEGGESSRKPDRRVIVYVTDGPSGSDAEGLRGVAEWIRSRRLVEVFAVGLGEDTDPAELASIADSSSGRRRGRRVFRLLSPEPRDVESLARELTLALCGVKKRSKSGPV